MSDTSPSLPRTLLPPEIPVHSQLRMTSLGARVSPEQVAAANALVEAIFSAEQGSINAAYGARYLTIIGFVLLIYDHALTFKREKELIWRAPASAIKYMFLINRYIVPIGTAVVLYQMSGFIGLKLTNTQCQDIFAFNLVLALVSNGLANLVLLMRLVALWKHNRAMVFTLTLTYVLAYASILPIIILAIQRIIPSMVWSPIVGMCIPSVATPYLLGVWGCSLFIEIVVIGTTCWNAVDRPRIASQPLLQALRRDGLFFFGVITCCRIINLCLAATNDPRYSYMTVYASWNIVTLLVSRMYLHLRTVDRTPLLLPTLTQLRPTRSHHSKQFVQRPSYDKRRSDGSLCIRSEPVCWEADEDNAAIEQLPAVARR